MKALELFFKGASFSVDVLDRNWEKISWVFQPTTIFRRFIYSRIFIKAFSWKLFALKLFSLKIHQNQKLTRQGIPQTNVVRLWLAQQTLPKHSHAASIEILIQSTLMSISASLICNLYSQKQLSRKFASMNCIIDKSRVAEIHRHFISIVKSLFKELNVSLYDVTTTFPAPMTRT